MGGPGPRREAALSDAWAGWCRVPATPALILPPPPFPLPPRQSLNLADSVSQFSHTMTAQCDLRVEAAHLHRFYANFRRLAGSVVVPRAFNGACAARRRGRRRCHAAAVRPLRLRLHAPVS